MPRLTLFKKILFITLLLSLLPLVASSLILLSNLETVNSRLTAEIADTSDIQAAESLQMRAQHVAENIEAFLNQCENDLMFLSTSSLNKATLLKFYSTRSGEIWERHGSAAAPRNVRRQVPIYRSFAIIDNRGKERIVIRDGRFLTDSELQDVSSPAGTEFKSEDYFHRIKQLMRSEIYVSHLTGFHISKQEQLAGAPNSESAFNGAIYEGVIRFGSPLYSPDGTFTGMVVISLDHRHLMEFTQHIDPGMNFFTPFPTYQSGNYAFLFDDEGWIITHPNFWDIRGVDKNGRPIRPLTATASKAEIEAGFLPFNLDNAGFIHTNYPVVATAVREQRAGYVDITNFGGAKKIMAYAPIPYDTGDYHKHRVFGGVTIGFQVDQFHDVAHKGSRMITKELGEHRSRSAIILLMTAILAGLAAWRLSRDISRPLRQLTEGAHRLAQGVTDCRVEVATTDEIGELASTFNFMAEELELRKNSLLSTLDELRRSRLDILDERNFKESVLESISSAIVTFSPDGLLTSINATGKLFLGNDVSVNTPFQQVFSDWGDMSSRVARALNSGEHYGREPFSIDRNGCISHFDVGFFPIGRNAEKGLTVTMRNETEKEKLREEMMRLDRLASLGKLSAGIAHEVRNPLTGISLLLDDLHDRTATASDDQIMIKKALGEIERVERLINALLNYSSPARVEFRQSDLNHVLQDTVLLMHRQCERQGVTISAQLEDSAIFRFDPEKIKQALLNIIRNALEAMPAGGKIIIAASADADHVTITISDNGPGIPKADQQLIFEPFFTRKVTGTGLGLSITQRIVDEHHGQISVNSDATSGTLFILKLPLTT